MSHRYRKSLSCCESAINLLSRRDHGQEELKNKLRSKGYEASEVEEAIIYCDRLGYLDDQRFAESVLRQHIRKGHGLQRIRQEMKQKSLHSDIIDHVLSDVDIDWFELARETALKKFDLSISVDHKQKAKQIRFLQYRGFTFEQIQYALDPMS